MNTSLVETNLGDRVYDMWKSSGHLCCEARGTRDHLQGERKDFLLGDVQGTFSGSGAGIFSRAMYGGPSPVGHKDLLQGSAQGTTSRAVQGVDLHQHRLSSSAQGTISHASRGSSPGYRLLSRATCLAQTLGFNIALCLLFFFSFRQA